MSLNPGERRDYAFELARWALPTQLRELLGLYVENQTLLDQTRSRQAREVLLTGTQRELSRSTALASIRANSSVLFSADIVLGSFILIALVAFAAT